MSSAGQCIPRVYNTEHEVSLPVNWLVQAITRADRSYVNHCVAHSWRRRMASAHFEQRVSAMQKFAAQYLPHLTSSEQTGLTTFVDCLSQHYGANLLHVVLLVPKRVVIPMISLTWMCW